MDWLWLAESSKTGNLCRCTPSRVGSTLAQRSNLRRRDQSHTCNQAKTARDVSALRSTKGKDTLLTLENVGRTHDGHTQLFSDVSAIISRGQRLAVVGPNGCGKTTLLRLIAGLAHYNCNFKHLSWAEVARTKRLCWCFGVYRCSAHNDTVYCIPAAQSSVIDAEVIK